MPPLPPDPYKILGVSQEAQIPEIRSAHRKLVLQCHPDKVQDSKLKAEKQAEFQKVQQAYELLSDEREREKYDGMARLSQARKKAKAPVSRSSAKASNVYAAESRESMRSSSRASPPGGTSYTYVGEWVDGLDSGPRVVNTGSPRYFKRESLYAERPSKRAEQRERDKERDAKERKAREREKEQERHRRREKERGQAARQHERVLKEQRRAEWKMQEKARAKELRRETGARMPPPFEPYTEEWYPRPAAPNSRRPRSSASDFASSYMGATRAVRDAAPMPSRATSYRVRTEKTAVPPAAPSPSPLNRGASASYSSEDPHEPSAHGNRRRLADSSASKSRGRTRRRSFGAEPFDDDPGLDEFLSGDSRYSHEEMPNMTPPRHNLHRTTTMLAADPGYPRVVPGISRAQTFNVFDDAGRRRSRRSSVSYEQPTHASNSYIVTDHDYYGVPVTRYKVDRGRAGLHSGYPIRPTPVPALSRAYSYAAAVPSYHAHHISPVAGGYVSAGMAMPRWRAATTKPYGYDGTQYGHYYAGPYSAYSAY